MVNFNSDRKLYHGVNSYVLIKFLNQKNREETDIHVSYIDKWELSKNLSMASRSQIGMYGEPHIVYPTGSSYIGSIKKYTDDNGIPRGRTDKDDFFTSLIKLDGVGADGEGLLNTFDLTFVSFNSAGERLVTKANRCILQNIKRGLKKDGFLMDEVSFRFYSIEEDIATIYKGIETYDGTGQAQSRDGSAP